MVTISATPSSRSGADYLRLANASTASGQPSPNQSLLPLSARVNAHDHLEVGGCDVKALVEQYGSPLYILDETTLRTACQQYRDALKQYYAGPTLAIYASKAWNCWAVDAIVKQEGLGIDVVSGGELFTAIKAGFSAEQTYFHGNNKSREELLLALEMGCNIVADNWLELRTLAELAQARAQSGETKPVPVMLRFTPGIECHTHEYIRTGHLDSKFGFDPEQQQAVFEFLSQQPQLRCIGLHAHIGSQIFELQPHHDLAEVLVRAFGEAQAHGLPVSQLNVGGGLGIRYTESDDPPSIETWVKQVCDALTAACEAHGLALPQLICEPGRSLIASACVTAYTIGSQKEVPGIRKYITVDGGMSDNPRPITYESVYRAIVANRMSAPQTETVTVAGKHCESGDVLIKDAQLPPTEPGDILVVLGTGAYNYSMSSNYNRLTRPAGVLVQGGEAEVFLERETYADLIRFDRLPERLSR
ncbi:MAG: diaminopimelate decarboxylase [Synechococcales cyanobacterium CRU_2_2]|nr:diaminopimelate decarboxylase [Synechococcales cyanobacterium CRU_2_2]